MAEVSERDMPLFVRVEGYKDVLKDLEAIRQILENMDESVQVLRKVQEVKEKSIQNFLENVERLDEKLDSVNVELPELNEMERLGIRPEASKDTSNIRKEDHNKKRVSDERNMDRQITEPRPVSREERTPDEEEIVDESINDLHSELKGLKDRLNNL